MTVEVSENRRLKLVEYIGHHLTTDSLPKGEASTLAGRLGFASPALFGGFGRALLNPIYARASQANPRRDAKLNADLRRALVWWQELLSSYPVAFRRHIGLLEKAKPTYILYTDASGIGLGAVLIGPDGSAKYMRFDFRHRQDMDGIENLDSRTLNQGTKQIIIVDEDNTTTVL